MKKNKISLLGLFGLIGLIGIPTGNYGFFGFFGFFGFLGLLSLKNDEMLRENIGKAAKNSFVVSLLGLATTIVLIATLESLEIASIAIAITFVVQILTFTFSLSLYEKGN